MPPIDRPPATMMSQCSLAAGRAPPRRWRTIPARSSGAAPRACRSGRRAGSRRRCGRRGRGLGRRTAARSACRRGHAPAGRRRGRPRMNWLRSGTCVFCRSCLPVPSAVSMHAGCFTRFTLSACHSHSSSSSNVASQSRPLALPSLRCDGQRRKVLSSDSVELEPVAVRVPRSPRHSQTAFQAMQPHSLLTRCRTRSSKLAGSSPSRAWLMCRLGASVTTFL